MKNFFEINLDNLTFYNTKRYTLIFVIFMLCYIDIFLVAE